MASENYRQTAKDFDLRTRAICSLLLKRYDDALSDFLALKDIEEKADRVSDDNYLYIALCYYALGDVRNAVDHFKYPVVNKKYIKYTSDISVPPCILYYLAIRLNRPDILKVATKELDRRKLTIPQFLLGRVTELELNKVYEEQPNEILIKRKKCKVEFYKAVRELQNENVEKYKMHLKNCIDVTGNFLEFEYYMAVLEYAS